MFRSANHMRCRVSKQRLGDGAPGVFEFFITTSYVRWLHTSIKSTACNLRDQTMVAATAVRTATATDGWPDLILVTGNETKLPRQCDGPEKSSSLFGSIGAEQTYQLHPWLSHANTFYYCRLALYIPAHFMYCATLSRVEVESRSSRVELSRSLTFLHTTSFPLTVNWGENTNSSAHRQLSELNTPLVLGMIPLIV